MNRVNRDKMRWIRGLMFFSQALIILFSVQWIITQYANQKEALKKDLTKVFTNVQHQVSDSILLNHALGADSAEAISKITKSNVKAGTDGVATISPQAVSSILRRTGTYTKDEEKQMFNIDTIAFNEMFASYLKMNGWDFKSEWINKSDSEKESKSIFINSDFFTQDNGVVVSNFDWYLFTRMLPQLCFILVLITLTAAAFFITYKSLRSQMRLSKIKDDFISNMSHELKTPIATVKLALEALDKYNVIDDPKTGREYLEMASSEMDRLELLATRVLNTALFDAGKIYLNLEQYDLKKLVNEVVQNMQLRIANQGARISVDAKGNNFEVAIDKLHMQGVLVNLIDNSLKYAVGHANIHITLEEKGGNIQLALSDNGPGIPEEYVEKVFEKFFRVPTGNRHNTRGYGLGLSYAAQVMRQHNGNICVNNLAAGGCMFTLTL